MTGPVLVDTNVLVYWKDERFPEKRRKAEAWLDRLWRSGRGRVSMQVLNEAYNTLTRKISPPYPVEEARIFVAAFEAWQPVAIDFGILRDAWILGDRHSVSFWDALVVSAARKAGCRMLLTEDLQDRQDFGGLEVIDPFLHEPDEALA